ncbi:MAG: AAA family ATPase [Gammaproteobacteria bacterium]|nr:AAA family ATPase [Gammaproteobacteria bacterium]
MNIPYGTSDFYLIRRDGDLYLDRTQTISAIESIGRQLLFLRPRRFGKSLLLSMLENYYDINRADEFASLFGNLAIAANPTPNHNRYFILKWNFSVVDANGDHEHIARGVHSHINSSINFFSARYHHRLPAAIELDESNALRSLENLLSAISRLGHPLYLLIDEYDNFANEVMSSRERGKQRYDELVNSEGVLKTLFKGVKAAAEGQGLERVFIVGVSPIVMSDITSGYNVAKNISNHPDLSRACGFTREEVMVINRQIAAQCQQPPEKADAAMALMQSFYNGYRFTLDDDERLYNPTLSLYFWDEWQTRCKFPRDLLDANLAMDRNRIAYVARLPHGQAVVAQALNPQQPLTVGKLANDFGIEAILNNPPDGAFLSSLLCHLGVLTIDGVTPFDELTLRIPNQVIRSLYVERMQQQLLNGYEDNNRRQAVAHTLCADGDFLPLADFIEERFFTAIDNRDLRWSNELTLKMTLLLLLTNDLWYLPRSELALGKGYSDLLFEVRSDLRHTPLYDLLFELKYLSPSKTGLSGEALARMPREELATLPVVKSALDTAECQLQHYQTRLKQQFPDVQWHLNCWAVISIGLGRLVWRAMPLS